MRTSRGRPLALFLALAIALQEFPANAQGAAARDLSEARRRFVAAVRASDQALATARAAVESAFANAAGSLGAEDQRARDALRTLRKGLADFAAEREKILARDLSSPENLLRAINDYDREVAAVAAIIVAVMVTIVAIVAVVATMGGATFVLVPVVLVVASAILVLAVTIVANLPQLIQGTAEIMRALGFSDAGDNLDSMGRWWNTNVAAGPVGKALKVPAVILQIVGEILRSAPSAESGMKAAEAAARDAQARLQTLPKLAPPPAAPAGPDLAEARRRFVAALQSSDQAVAAAEAALDELIRQAAALTSGDQQKNLESMRKGLMALRAFKAEKARILAQDLATTTKIYVAARDYARACQALAVSIAATVVVIAIVVTIFTLGSDVAAAGATLSAIAGELARLDASLTDLMTQIKVLRAAEEDEARRTKSAELQEEIKRNLEKAAASLGEINGALTSLHEAGATTQGAQVRLQALPKPPAPPPVLTSFDGYLGSAFTIHLDSGKATVGSAEATLEGGVTISPKNDPSLKLSASGRVVLKVRPGSSSGPAGPSYDQTTFRATVLGAGPQIATWASLEGQVSARITGFGPAIAIPNVALQSQASAVMFTGGEASFRGCTHTLAAGSGFTTSQVLLEGSLRCGPWSLTSSSMGIDKTSVAGAGTLTAWSKSFTMSYAASGDGLSPEARSLGADTPWARVPGFEAEYRIEAPKLDLKLEGPSLSPTFGAGKVNVRTIAKRPGGDPWSSASLTPDVVVARPADGRDYGSVPGPPGTFGRRKGRTRRLRAGGDRTLAGALQHGPRRLHGGHPSPPSVPRCRGLSRSRSGRSSDDPSPPETTLSMTESPKRSLPCECP